MKKTNNNGLLAAFIKYQKRSKKKTNWSKILPEIIYRTMRLEGEHITRKEAKALFIPSIFIMLFAEIFRSLNIQFFYFIHNI